MSMLRSIITNTAARSGAEIANRLGSAVFWVFVARYVGAAGLGSIAFAMSLFTLFEILATMGLGSAVIRDVAKQKNRAGLYFGQTLLLGLASSLVVFGLLVATVLLLKPNAETLKISFIIGLSLIPAMAFYWSRTILWAQEKLSYVAISRSFENMFKVAAGILVLVSGYGILHVAIVFLLSKCVSAIVCFSYAARTAKPVLKVNVGVLRHLLAQVPTFSLIAIFNGIFWSTTVILLTKLGNETQAGYFSAAYKLVDMCIALTLSYGQALFPITSRLSSSRVALLDELYKKSLKYLMLLTIALASATTVLADKIVPFIYGPYLMDAVPVLRMLVWIIVPFSAVPVLAYLLLSHHLQKYDLLANFVAAVGLVMFSILLIPQYLAVGAAAALLIGCVLFFTAEIYSVQKWLYKIKVRTIHLVPLFGVVIMSYFIFYLRNESLFLSTFAGGIFYLIFLWLTKTITDNEIRFVKQLRSA